MRKSVCAVLACVLTLSLTACSNTSGEEWISEDVVVGTSIVGVVTKDKTDTNETNAQQIGDDTRKTDEEAANGKVTKTTVKNAVTTLPGNTRTRRTTGVEKKTTTRRVAAYAARSVTELIANEQIRLIGRQAVTADAIVMDYNNATVKLYGELEGSVKMNVSNTAAQDCYVYVVVDGDAAKAKQLVIGKNDYVVELCSNLKKGKHTVEIIRATCCDWKSLEIYSFTYKGFLEKPPAAKLQIEFLGDSITCAVGAVMADNTYQLGAKWQDGFRSYAAITARNLNADASVLSLSGRTTEQVYKKFNDIRSDGDDNAWDLAANKQDIVVINLGTNDRIFGVDAATVKSAVNGLLRDIRTAYGKDTYIIWAYGMMIDNNLSTYKNLVQTYAADKNDDRILFCDLSSVKNTAGWSSHPNEKGQKDAAVLLTDFIRKNCKDAL